jgi:SanA protein
VIRAWLRRHPRLLWGGIGAAGALALVVIGSNAYILLSSRGESTDDPDEVEPAQAALVLGAEVKSDGTMSSMLADRVERAAQLWDAGKVDRILVSGDHGDWVYDEPDTMRKALLERGVPGRVIFEDHAGFDTWASVVRAKEVFGVTSAVIVTQGFHMPRALLLADEAGLDATGLTSDLHGYGNRKYKVGARELLARVKAIGTVVREPDVVLGPLVPISGDDGRVSWGPLPPPGTPPAGSPGP